MLHYQSWKVYSKPKNKIICWIEKTHVKQMKSFVIGIVTLSTYIGQCYLKSSRSVVSCHVLSFHIVTSSRNKNLKCSIDGVDVIHSGWNELVDDSVVSLVAAEQDLATVGGGDCLLENNFEIYSFNCRPLISVVELLLRLWRF